MKSIVLSACVLGLVSASAFAGIDKHGVQLELGLSATQLHEMYLAKKRAREQNTLGVIALHPNSDEELLAPALAAGRRLLQWVVAINAQRPLDQRLSLSSPETQHAYPIEAPNVYNPDILLKAFSNYKAQAPATIRDVILGDGALPATSPVSDADFIAWGLKLNDVYETSARWLNYQDSMAELEKRKQLDVRAYLNLKKEEGLDAKLTGWKSLSDSDRARLGNWLVQVCVNSEGDSSGCSRTLGVFVSVNNVKGFYDRYLPGAKTNYDSFFKLEGKRPDVTWTSSQPLLMSVPFVDPGRDDLRSYLKDNIEDEWRWNDWFLKLPFVANRPNTAHLEFEAGATPHVNDVAGNTITMDANAPLSEYNVRWAIRHEYGHVLGFPDCYLEFYDRETDTIQSYQLDITNLMCSRRGHINQLHFDELKEAYFR